MFAVAGFRPQHIANSALFRMSFSVFGIAIIVPSLVEGLTTFMSLDKVGTSRTTPPNSAPGMVQIVSILFYYFGKILFAIAVVLGLASLRLGPERQDVPRVRPVERER